MTLFDQIPIWLVYLGTVVFALLAAQLGFLLSARFQHRIPEGKKNVVTAALVGGLLGLLAFILAFSTSYVLNRFNDRRVLVVKDANAIEIAYLRSGYLDEPDRSEARDLLREYTELKLSSLDPENSDSAFARFEAIQARLWTIAAQNGREHPASIIIGLFGESINDVIDIHASRLAVDVGTRIPPIMWSMLYAIVFIAFLLVGVASSADDKRNYFALILFALGFAVVLALIVDLDRPQQGSLRVSQEAIFNLQRHIKILTP